MRFSKIEKIMPGTCRVLEPSHPLNLFSGSVLPFAVSFWSSSPMCSPLRCLSRLKAWILAWLGCKAVIRDMNANPGKFVPNEMPLPQRITERPIFALIIGIDIYQEGGPPPLRGCISDSNKVLHYLKDNLYVPRENIVVLQNDQATRQNILNAFKNHLIHNSVISRDDAIIFYFAGHGSRQAAPDNWHAEDNQVETICPFDVTTDFGIPDYTISSLLRKLVQYKGNNITLIFDSCHSGGMGRADKDARDDNAPRIRCYNPLQDLPSIPAHLDQEIWAWNSNGERSGTLTAPDVPGSMYKAMESHVLLAACQPRQSAGETKVNGEWSGAFTSALIGFLKTWDPRLSPMTYLRIMENLPPLEHQNPHCEGKNRVRRLFSPSDVGCDDPAWFVVTAASESNDMYYVAAGFVLGVVKGTEFISHPPEGSTPLTLIAKVVEEFRCLAVLASANTSTCDLAIHTPHASILPQHSRVTISRWRTKWLGVEFEPRDAFSNIVEDDDSLFAVVETGGDLRVSRTDSIARTAELVRNDHLIASLPECRRMSVSFDSVTCNYLNKAARFHFFLYQLNSSQTLSQVYRGSNDISPSVTVYLQKLRLSYDLSKLIPGTLIPTGDNLFCALAADSPMASTLTGIAVLNGPDSEANYGLTLQNHTSTNLFAYVFFFDPRQYAIEPLYLPHSSLSHSLRRHDKEGSTLGIGYGAQGADAIGFSLPEGIDEDSAFLRIFVSTVHINMEALVMPPGRLNVKKRDPYLIEHCWDSWTYLVTVRR